MSHTAGKLECSINQTLLQEERRKMKRICVDAAGNYLGILNSAYTALSFGNLVKIRKVVSFHS